MFPRENSLSDIAFLYAIRFRTSARHRWCGGASRRAAGASELRGRGGGASRCARGGGAAPALAGARGVARFAGSRRVAVALGRGGLRRPLSRGARTLPRGAVANVPAAPTRPGREGCGAFFAGSLRPSRLHRAEALRYAWHLASQAAARAQARGAFLSEPSETLRNLQKRVLPLGRACAPRPLRPVNLHARNRLAGKFQAPPGGPLSPASGSRPETRRGPSVDLPDETA